MSSVLLTVVLTVAAVSVPRIKAASLLPSTRVILAAEPVTHAAVAPVRCSTPPVSFAAVLYATILTGLIASLAPPKIDLCLRVACKVGMVKVNLLVLVVDVPVETMSSGLASLWCLLPMASVHS